MECLNLLLYINLFIIAINANENFENILSEMDNQTNVLPLHYTIAITPRMELKFFAFNAKSNISIKIQNATTYITVQLNWACILEIGTVTLIHDSGRIYQSFDYISREMYIVELHFSDNVPPGFYTLELGYMGIESQKKKQGAAYNKFFSEQYNYAAWIAVKPFATIMIRDDLQCYDHPQLKPTYNISVKYENIRNEYTVLSNMPLQIQEKDEYGNLTSHFIITPEMSSCEATIVLFNFARVFSANETVNIWCRLFSNRFRIDFAQNVVKKVAQHMVELTNTSKKMDFIVMPGFLMTWHDLAKNLFIYNEDDIFYEDNNQLSTAQNEHRKKLLASMITNKIIQNWLDNLITPFSSGDLWLTAGLPYFFEAYILDKIFENWQIMDFMVIRNLSLCLDVDDYLYINDPETKNSRTIGHRKSIYRALIGLDRSNFTFPSNFSLLCSLFQDKGPLILRMLQQLIGDDMFRKGFNLFFRIHRATSMTSDLWNCMEIVLRHESKNFPHLRIKTIMDPWIRKESYPIVTVELTDENTTIVTQNSYIYWLPMSNNSLCVYAPKWYIPLTITTQGSYFISHSFINSKNDLNMNIRSDEWIIVNMQQVGYYRVNYDTDNWFKIADYLNSENYTKIHVTNRVQLINDAFYILFNKLDWYSHLIFCNLTKYLSRTTDYASWYPMFSILPRLENVTLLKNETECQKHLANNFLRFLGGIEYGDDALNENDFIKENTYKAIQWACKYNISLCEKLALNKLEKYLADNTTDKISHLWREWIYCTGLRTANIIIWKKVLDMYEQNYDRTFLNYLACSEDINILIYYLNTLFSYYYMYGNVYLKEINYAYKIITARHLGKNIVLDNLLKVIETLKPMAISVTKAFNFWKSLRNNIQHQG